jgi:hypothetical protein
MRSVWSRSKVRLSGKEALRYVLFPVFLGPQRKADCRLGRAIRRSLSIVTIREWTPY